MEIDLLLETIPQFFPLFNKDNKYYRSRYKVFYGGRGGRKSWEVARACILKATQSKLLIVCTREFQNSISDSVLRLLANQIEMMGLSWFFEIQRTTIIGKNGSEFIFKGLNGLTVDSIKSLEGADICYVAKVNYTQNPDCPDVLIQEAEDLKRVDYEAYAHVWLGEVRAHSEAQVFRGKYRVEGFEINESFGYPLHGVDWGFANDPTVLIRLYINNRKLYIRSEAYKIGCEVTDLPALFQRLPDIPGYILRAENARPELISHVQRQGFRIEAADKWPGCPEDRVQFIRSFEQIIIHPDCPHTAEEFRLFSYKTDKRTGDVLPVLE